MTRTFTAEIIGPAGSGKSTLTSLLSTHDSEIKTGLSIWGLPLTLLIPGAISSIRELITSFVSRRSNWEDVKLVIQINAMRRLLARESGKGYRALLCDEGGVFGLARLKAFGLGNNAASSGWMNGLFNHVAPTLDAVIWLDAADTVLAQRIREREKPHRTKHLSEAEIFEHLAMYRTAFEKVVGELKRRNSFEVIRFRTDRESLDDIARQILAGAGGHF